MFIVVGASGNTEVGFSTFEPRNDKNKVPVFTTHEAALEYGRQYIQQMIGRLLKYLLDRKESDFTVSVHEQDSSMLHVTDGHSNWEFRVVEFDLPKNDYEIHRTGFQNYALWCKGNPINITSSQVVVDSWKKQFNIV